MKRMERGIGGEEWFGHRSLLGLLAGGMASLAFAACSNGPGLTQPDSPTAPQIRAEITCTVTPGSLSCEPDSESEQPDGTAAVTSGGNTTLGGQNTYVQLAGVITDDVAGGNDSDPTLWAADVTVKNLIMQPMATTASDGSDASGTDEVIVFFEELPTAKEGENCTTLEVANPDGTDGNFTGSNQTFYSYGEDTELSGDFLAAGETSSSKNWQFNVNDACDGFTFTVFVTTNIPHENSVLIWTREAENLTQHRLKGIWGVSRSDIWAVGREETIIHYDGTSWSIQISDPTVDQDEVLHDVWAMSSDSVFVVGGNGLLYETSDGGATWNDESAKLGTGNGLTSIWGTSDGSHIWIVGGNGTIFHSDDQGATWSAQSLPDGIGDNQDDLQAVFGVVSGGSTTVLAVSKSTISSIFRTTDLGATWVKAKEEAAGMNGVWGGSLDDWWVTNESGEIRYSGDGGDSWATQADFGDGIGHQMIDIFGFGTSDVFVTGQGGTLVHYDGTDWMEMENGLPDHPINGVWGTSGTIVWHVGREADTSASSCPGNCAWIGHLTR